MGKKDEYHFKVAVERGRSSSGIILHDGFNAFTFDKKHGNLLTDLKRVFPAVNYKTRFFIIGTYVCCVETFFHVLLFFILNVYGLDIMLIIADKAGDEMIWTMYPEYDFLEWLEDNSFTNEDQIKLFIKSETIPEQPVVNKLASQKLSKAKGAIVDR